MAKNNNLQDFLTDIANTIREENGSTELINPQDFGSKITGIGDKLRNIIQGTVTEITPEMLTGITTLRPFAFSGYDNLTKITLPEGVTYIGSCALDGCSSLVKLNLPNSLEQFPPDVLLGPIGGTEHLEFNSDDNGVMYLGNDTNPYMVLWSGEVYDENFAFQSGTKIISGGYGFYVQVSTLNIPDQIVSLESSSISGDAEVVNIGSGLKFFDSNAFTNISNLREINISDSNAFFSSVGGIVYDKSKTKFIQVPKNIATAEIPDTIIKIPISQFQSRTSLASVTIPNSVQTIEGSAFYGCSNLTSVTLPSSVTSIGTNVFYNCAKLSYASVPNVGNYMFESCKALISVDIANGATRVGDSAFHGCTGLPSITIPNSVTSIGDSAFYGCTSLASINIPHGVKVIGYSAFKNCIALTSITIPAGVTNFGSYAFDGCSGLTSVSYEGQPSFPNYVFRGCSKVSKYDFRNAASVPTLGATSYLGHATGCKIIVPDALHDSWKSATNWSALTGVSWVKASEYVEE